MNLPRPRPLLRSPAVAGLLALAGACLAPAAHADGLANLRGALARLAGHAPLKATLEVRGWRRSGEGADVQERQASVTLGLEDGPRGLQPAYGRELFARLDAEARAAIKDKKAAKPVSEVLEHTGVEELRLLASAAPVIARDLDESAFKGESAETLDGRPVRKLVFERGIDTLADGDRKYAREFQSVLTVWIAPDGTPLASRRHLQLSGRAFVVVTFEQRDDDDRSYAVVGDRLVTVRHDEKGHAQGAGENQDYRIEHSLQVLP
jgi:hypothetical protein